MIRDERATRWARALVILGVFESLYLEGVLGERYGRLLATDRPDAASG